MFLNDFPIKDSELCYSRNLHDYFVGGNGVHLPLNSDFYIGYTNRHTNTSVVKGREVVLHPENKGLH